LFRGTKPIGVAERNHFAIDTRDMQLTFLEKTGGTDRLKRRFAVGELADLEFFKHLCTLSI
jgi:hypothetical protein